MDKLAQKIEATFRWDDIVLPPHLMKQLHEVAASFRDRRVAHSDWGLENKHSFGNGVNALFTGAKGTGKTMAAQILARELGLDLYRIDLASIANKYIGETEKNLDRIFRMAQASNSILLFDESDALFGRRSDVKDAHDRFANIEIAYLLQKLEEYDGIVVIATNLRGNLDEAFTRRMRHIVGFPFPDRKQRTRIWERIFSDQAPLGADIDCGFLGHQFELTGGSIRNVALAAALMAADSAGPIDMRHVTLAIAGEIQKMGKMPSESGFKDIHDLVRSEHCKD